MTKLTDVTVFGKGIYLPGGVGNPDAKAPERKEGDIKGWSAASRRRMREWIMTHQAPEGWKSWAVDLTFPPLPVGRSDVTVKQSDALLIFETFRKRCERVSVGAVWRLEIQPRKDAERIDVRGIPQPHYHLIAISPPSLSESTFSEMWLGVLGERGEVKGAKKYACKVASCEDWQSARVRYLIDHASKSKAAQIAVGWGRHWGVFGRGLYGADKGRVVLLDGRQEVWLRRLMRRGLRRRVVDQRAAGGIPWSCGVVLKPFPLGVQCDYMGGSVMLKGWDGVGLPPVADRRRLARVLGVARSNVWALKLARGRVQRGFRFCNGEAFNAAAVRMASAATPDPLP